MSCSDNVGLVTIAPSSMAASPPPNCFVVGAHTRHTPKQAVRGGAQPRILVRHGLHAADGAVAQRPRRDGARFGGLQLALVAERRRVGRAAALFDDATAHQLPKGLQQFVPLRFGGVPKDEDPAVFGVVGSRRRGRQIVVGIGREPGGGALRRRKNDETKVSNQASNGKW